MTEYIGNVPVSSIQNVEISRTEGKDEIDLVDEDSNIVVEGIDEGQEIQIDFTLMKRGHPEELDVDQQLSEAKELVSNDVIDNSFKYNGSQYHLSIGDVSISESSDLRTIRQGTITAQALPWPKHYPEETPGANLRVGGDILFSMDLSGEPQIVSLYPKGEVDYSLDLEAFSKKLISSISEIDYELSTEGKIDSERSVDSSVNYTLEIEDTIADMEQSSVGVAQFTIDSTADSSLFISSESEADYSIDVVGTLDGSVYGLFGRYFGRNFGGN